MSVKLALPMNTQVVPGSADAAISRSSDSLPSTLESSLAKRRGQMVIGHDAF